MYIYTYIYIHTHSTNTHIHTNTHANCSTPLIEWSALRRSCYLCNTQQTQEKNINALNGIRTRDPSNQAAADLSPRPHVHRYLPRDIRPQT